MKNGKLSVKPLIASAEFEVSREQGPSNLYVRDLDKSYDEAQVRRAFAMFGKIQSFKLVNKAEFTTNIAFVAYACPRNAKFAFEHAVAHSKLGQFSIEWHKQKVKDAGRLLSDISNQLEKLELLNLKADPTALRRLKDLGMHENCDLSSLRANFELIKADLHFHALQSKFAQTTPASLEQTLAMFVESICEEKGNTEIDPQQKAKVLLEDVGKLEECAKMGFERFLELVLE